MSNAEETFDEIKQYKLYRMNINLIKQTRNIPRVRQEETYDESNKYMRQIKQTQILFDPK